jgi:hypothetical protein
MAHTIRAFESHGLEQVADAVFLPWDFVAAPGIDYHAKGAELWGVVYAVRLMSIGASPRKHPIYYLVFYLLRSCITIIAAYVCLQACSYPNPLLTYRAISFLRGHA